MNPDWASENLQTIRTLMERSALYRRALGPVMLLTGLLGMAGAGLSFALTMQSDRSFALYWMGLSVLALTAAFLLVRQQAIKAHEPVWSPPTRRVFQALLPGLFAGMVIGLIFVVLENPPPHWTLPGCWVLCYGVAIHAAGFFMPRGMKLFGWVLILLGSAYLLAAPHQENWQTIQAAHLAMGIIFGAMQFLYGIYLLVSEKQKKAA